MKSLGFNRRRRQISRKLQEINFENGNYIASLEEISSHIIPTPYEDEEESEQSYLITSILNRLIFKPRGCF